MQLVSQPSDPRPQTLKVIAVTRRGFTIVELLIVIVVIAVLAAITIVAYNGIQQRANNAKTMSAVEAYVKYLQMYKTDNGDFPKLTSCLGVGYAAEQCRGDGGSYVEDHGNLNSIDLQPYIGGSVPSPSNTKYPYPGTTVYIAGAYYQYPSDNTYNPSGGPGIGVILSGSGCPSVGGLSLATDTVSGGAILCRYGLN
jgi:prepilin-type N-terminal cleavage/methylation domain-containing protein